MSEFYNVPTFEAFEALQRAVVEIADGLDDAKNGLGGAIDTLQSELADTNSDMADGLQVLQSQADLILSRLVAVEHAQSDLPLIASAIQGLSNRIATLEAKLEPPPPPPPPPPQPSSRIKVSDFKLVGGIRLNETYSGGGLAIDFEKGLIYQGGHSQRDMIVVHELPAIGIGEPGTKHANWPMAVKRGELAPWHKAQPYGDNANMTDCNLGLTMRDGKLWCSARVKYDTSATNRNIILVADDGERINVPLERAGFGGGFIEGHPDLLIGCGGYRSGQGSKAGPTVARLDGTRLLDAPIFNDMRFGARTPRASGSWPVTGKDEWYAFIPRKDNGELCTMEEALAGVGVGAWNSDSIYDGGVWTPRGLMFWATMGMGVLDYKLQSPQFAKSGMSRPFLYTYDPITFEYQGFEAWPFGDIHGCEVGPDGRIYLMRDNAWSGTYGQPYSAIYVFEIE
jgi:hypothetical protein